jgi:plastocyanin
MRRIILLMTVAALAVVSTLFVVSASGAHKHPTAKANKNPTRTVLIQDFHFKPAHITIKGGTKVRWINKDTSPHTQRPTTEDRSTQDVWVEDRGIHTPSREQGRSPTTARYTPT